MGDDKAEECAAAIKVALAWIAEHRPDPKAAIVWRAYDEPACFSGWAIRCMDDCDYVALVPHDKYFHFMESGTSFGCCDVSTLALDDKWDLVCGYHS